MKRFVERMLGRPEPTGIKPGARDYDEDGHAQLPPGRRVYCIGDIHGRLDLLDELHGLIRNDSADFQGSLCIIYLGDFIDRGPDSRQVLDRLIEQPLARFDAIHLLGNHEQAMLDFLAYPEAAMAWLQFGGEATLLSYGIEPGRVRMRRRVDLLRDELQGRLPRSHREFLATCRQLYVEGSYCFVHAGIRPGIELPDQRAEDLLWIRGEFTESVEDHGYTVVHGHSITEDVEWRPNRIGIDTGAFYTGVLSALVLEAGQRRLLQTGQGGDGF